MNRILVIEDEGMIRKQLTKLLERNSFEVGNAGSIDEALQLEPDSFDLVLADIRLPGAPGTAILDHVDHVPVIVMTSHASVRSAVDSMKLGAIDYISKPFDHDELLLVIERSLRENRLTAQNAAMRHDLHRLFPHNEILTDHPALNGTIESLQSLPEDQHFVFLQGERGTGKELLARLSHEACERAKGPLVFADLPVYEEDQLEAILLGTEHANSDDVIETSLSKTKHARFGLMHSAHAGTIILRNVAQLPSATQRKLAQLVPTKDNSRVALNPGQKQFNVRIIAINLEPLETAFAAGQLTPEFAACFEGSVYSIPPLRERAEDMQALIEHYLHLFLKRYRKRKITLSDSARHALQAYHWPGNVNELKSVLERAALMVDAEEIQPVHLGLGILEDGVDNIPIDLSLDSYFRYFVMNYQSQLSETELAAKLGISRKALWERRQKMALPRNLQNTSRD